MALLLIYKKRMVNLVAAAYYERVAHPEGGTIACCVCFEEGSYGIKWRRGCACSVPAPLCEQCALTMLWAVTTRCPYCRRVVNGVP
jgi:hypothetical protein